MARLAATPPPARWPWWIPAVGLALAAASYFLAPRPDAVISTESLLTAYATDAADPWVSDDDAARPDNVLEISLEET
jgi:hypothetical protein